MDAKGGGDGGEKGQQGRAQGGLARELARGGHSGEHHSLEDAVEPHQLVQLGLGSVAAASTALNAQ